MAHLTGAIGYPQPTSEVVSYSSTVQSKILLGTEATDGKGNVYVYVDFDSAKAVGEIVTFDADFLATDCGATTVGFIGIVCAESPSSDNAGWVQVKGIHTGCLAGSALTSGFLGVGATTDGYSVPVNFTAQTTDLTYRIVGMNAVSSASTATTPGYASTGSSILGVYTARLNYPYVMADAVTS